MVLIVVLAVGIRLGLVLAATAIAGQWNDVPWGAWAVIFTVYALIFGGTAYSFTPPEVPTSPWLEHEVRQWTALLPRLERESDLDDLDDFMRRWDRPVREVVVGLVVAAAMLSWAWLVAPAALDELPVGSFVLLAVLLFDFGAIPIFGGTLTNTFFMARQARYDYHLFWPSPADSPEVQTALAKTNTQGFITGMWISVFLVLTIVLVSWDSPLVAPLATGFIVIGYVATFTLTLRNRASIQKIVRRARGQRLQELQERIDDFEPRYLHLTPQELDQLQGLFSLHDKIRDAPATPTTTRTVLHTAVGLIIPTLLFIATVFGEVYAERILDTILP